jgi:hypothetical protein
MAENNKSGDEYLFEITSFLITSAKRCAGPEYMYGTGRLIQTLVLLSYLPDYVPALQGNNLLMKARQFVEGDQHWWYKETLEPFIEEISSTLLDEMKKKLEKKK